MGSGRPSLRHKIVLVVHVALEEVIPFTTYTLYPGDTLRWRPNRNQTRREETEENVDPCLTRTRRLHPGLGMNRRRGHDRKEIGDYNQRTSVTEKRILAPVTPSTVLGIGLETWRKPDPG